MRHDTSQKNIIEKFILFMEIEGKQPLSGAEKEKMRKGLCTQFSLVYAFMRACGKKYWWRGVLEAIAAWDGKVSSLRDEIEIVDETERQTLYLLMVRAVNYILSSKTSLKSFKDVHQLLDNKKFMWGYFLELNGPFDSDLGKIISRTTVSGYFTDSLLNSIIQEEFFWQNAIFLLTMQNKDMFHTCFFYYSASKRKWCFHDPSEIHDFEYSEKADFIRLITKYYGRSLSIEMATWEQRASVVIAKFSQHCEEQIKKHPLKHLVQEYGLYLIVRQNANTALKIICDAKANQETYNAFCNALSSQYEKFRSTLNWIVHYEAHLLPFIFSIMVNGETGRSRNCLTNIFSNKIQKTLGDFLYQIIRNSKDSIPLIIALSQKHKNFLITFSRYLNFKSNNNCTPLLAMMQHSEDFTKEIVSLASKKNIYFYMALMVFFTVGTDYSKSKELVTYFDQILFWMINSDTLFGEIIQKSDSDDTLAQKIINTFSLLGKYSETEVKAYLNKILLASNNSYILKEIINRQICSIEIQSDILPKIINKIIDFISESDLKRILLKSNDRKVLQSVFAHPNCSNEMLKDFFNRSDIDYFILVGNSPKDKAGINFIRQLVLQTYATKTEKPNGKKLTERLRLAVAASKAAPSTPALSTPEKKQAEPLNGGSFRQAQFFPTLKENVPPPAPKASLRIQTAGESPSPLKTTGYVKKFGDPCEPSNANRLVKPFVF